MVTLASGLPPGPKCHFEHSIAQVAADFLGPISLFNTQQWTEWRYQIKSISTVGWEICLAQSRGSRARGTSFQLPSNGKLLNVNWQKKLINLYPINILWLESKKTISFGQIDLLWVPFAWPPSGLCTFSFIPWIPCSLPATSSLVGKHRIGEAHFNIFLAPECHLGNGHCRALCETH